MADGSYAIIAALVRPLLRSMARIYASGVEHVPLHGAALMVSNHISHFDPPLLGYPLPRPVDYLALDDFFKNSLTNRFLRAMNSHPFNRTKTDRPAVKWALQRLKQGRLVGVFPERGIRFAEGSILLDAPVSSGTAALAQVAEVPVIPTVILGADQLYQWRTYLPRPRIFIHYSAPLEAGSMESSDDFARRISHAIRATKRELMEHYEICEEEMPQDAPDRWKQRGDLSFLR